MVATSRESKRLWLALTPDRAGHRSPLPPSRSMFRQTPSPSIETKCPGRFAVFHIAEREDLPSKRRFRKRLAQAGCCKTVARDCRRCFMVWQDRHCGSLGDWSHSAKMAGKSRVMTSGPDRRVGGLAGSITDYTSYIPGAGGPTGAHD